MAKINRWGKKHKYKRDWKAYNEELVRRGTFFINTEFLKKQSKELKKMNKGKIGRPYEYSNSFIRFQGLIHDIGLDYRGVEGFTRQLKKYVPELPVDDYSTICRRVNKLNETVKVPKGLKDVFAVYDSSGIKVSNRGEWMRQKWQVRRGWIKVNIVVDVKRKKLLDIEATEEGEADGEVLEKQIDRLAELDINKLGADGALDRRHIYNKLEERGIEPVIKPRKNASTRARGSPARAREVRKFKSLGYKEWAKRKKYGQRWAAEGKFSCVKRKFGETIRATKKENMLKEAERKFLFYEKMVQYAKI